VNTSIEFQAGNIKFLEFEINNQCQYALDHDWCPRNRLGENPFTKLPVHSIIKVMEYFAHFNFNGTVYFSIYNEPLLDPGIYGFIRLAKDILPQCTVQMYTNGLLLNTDTADKLIKAGLDTLRISVYSERADFSKVISRMRSQGFNNISLSPRLDLRPKTDAGYDDRIDLYDRDLHCTYPCYMPIQYFNVNCKGDVMLCWDEWKSSVTFGNVNTDSVEDILMNPKRLSVIEDLKQGNRYGVCAGCDRPTEMCISEYRRYLRL
jgi:radical SAM protein with 4Fe4S-binding SPASM domain